MFSFGKKEEKMVDAIDDGRIVRVSEEHARREGLLILRKSAQTEQSQSAAPQAQPTFERKKEPSRFDSFRKPLRTQQNDVLSSLAPNFHWAIAAERKQRKMTRKQLADAIRDTEYNIKVIENGTLPADDFILVSKIERYFNISLRKDKPVSLKSLVPMATPVVPRSKSSAQAQSAEGTSAPNNASEDADGLLGDGIEVLDSD